MAKKRIPPEQWAEWAEVRKRMEKSLRRYEARTAELKEREESAGGAAFSV